MENSLPDNWAVTKLGEVCHTTSGGTPSRRIASYFNGNIPWVKSGELEHNVILKTEEKISEDALVNSSAKIFPSGTLLIALYGATVGKLAFLGIDASTNQAVCGIFKNKAIELKLLYWYLYYKRQDLINQSFGGAQPNISQTILKELEVPLPPLPEQHRIVAKLDAILQKIESNKQRLERIPKLLKGFRQRVLSAAVSGKLTEDWREKNGIVEEWKEIALGDCIFELRNGLGKKPNISPPGVPILRISAVRPGFVDFSDIRYYDSEENNIENFYLENEDLLFTRYNGSIEFLGVCGLVREITQEFVYPDKLMRVRVNKELLNPNYCEIYFQSEQARNEILKYAKSSAGQNGISGGDLKKVIVNCPLIEEQKEIVRRVAQLFAFADKIEARYAKAKAMLDKLPQTILAKAFRGELVPQDPNDEPASVLLERIKAEKAKVQAAPPRKGRSKKKVKAE